MEESLKSCSVNGLNQIEFFIQSFYIKDKTRKAS
jgi:hypothetical protein